MSKTLIKIEQIGSPIRRHHSQRETLMVRPTMAFGADTEGNRAAIMGYGIGAPRDWAEALARLDPAQPPADVPDGRWRSSSMIVACFWIAAGASRLRPADAAACRGAFK
jgi:hypothetical protein